MKIELDGKRVFVGTGGSDWSGDRPVLLLLHGAGMDRTVWVLLARYFARHGFDVAAPDLPGHGGSEGPALTSIDAQADWTWRLVDHLRATVAASGAEPAHDEPDQDSSAGGNRLVQGDLVCAGHSMGALAALAMAGSRPDDVARLVLLGVGYPMAVGKPLLSAAAKDVEAAVDMITLFAHAHASRLGRNTVAGISVVNSAAALIARAAPGVLHTDLSACHAWQGGEHAAAQFGSGRSAIIAGDEDRMTPMRATRSLAALLSAEIDLLDDCGHMVMSEQPEHVLQALKRQLMPA